MAAPRVQHVWRAKLTAISLGPTHHPLHLALPEDEFSCLNHAAHELSLVVAVGRNKEEITTTGSDRLYACVRSMSTGQHQNQNIGHVTELSNSNSTEIKLKPCPRRTESTLVLYCTRRFLWHYNFMENEEVYIKLVLPHGLQKIVIGAKNEEAFSWAQEKAFTTGLLLSVCEQKVIFRQDDVLLIPHHSLYGAFDMDLLFEYNVVETAPFNQGLLTVKTELVVVQMYHDNPSCDPGTVFHPKCHETPEMPVLLSDFTSRLSQKHGGVASTASDAPQLLEVNVIGDCHVFKRINGSKNNAEFDNNGIIFVPEEIMKQIGLFEGCLVELSVPPQTGQESEQPDASDDARMRKKKREKRQRHIAVVRMADQSVKTACLSPVLSFNIGRRRGTLTNSVLIARYESKMVDGIYSSSLSEISYLPYAKEVHISVVQSPNYSQTASLDILLQRYFTTTRILKEGDVVCLSAQDDVEYYQSLDDVIRTRSPSIYVVVTKIQPHIHGCHGYRVDVTHSILFQEGTVHAFVPPGMDQMGDTRGQICASDVGLAKYVDKVIDLSQPHLKHRKECEELLPTFLLSGPAACGKSLVAQQVASKLNMHLYQVDCQEMCRETRAASEAKVKAVMHRAATFSPCVLLLRGVQVIGKMPEGTDEDPRLISVFLEILSQTLLENKKFPIIAIATTHVAKQLNADLQEGFLHHITVEVPDEETRTTMLSSLSRNLSVSPDVSVKHIAQRTAGLVLGDLQVLCNHARGMAIQRLRNFCFPGRHFVSLEDEADMVNAGIVIQQSDFTAALDLLQSAHSDAIGAPKIPNVSWDDVGGLVNVKADILDTIQLPLEHPELFAAGLRRSGVLLYGPPGVGKTLLAKAVATECSLNFLSVKGPELINMYVGQSEENVRQVFARARDASPCVIFFDELDSLAPNRGRSGDSGGVMDRVVSQLLAELDGLHKSCDVFVIGATNRPDLLDPALLRPGRFDKLLYLGVSEDKESQLNIMKALTRKFSLVKDYSLEEIVEHCPSNLTGADFYALCSDAMLNAMKRKIAQLNQGIDCDQSHIEVEKEDFLQALSTLVPSVSITELQNYQSLQNFYKTQ